MTAQEFVEEVFFGKAYTTRSLIVGFNLPFDLSRLAIGHDSARPWSPPKKKRPDARLDTTMHGGFSLKLSEDRRWPRVQVRHLPRTSR